ncbi:unnamed protein product [Vitrella brassicaformis CCMP3155]|uniref:Uncharacterized protein n=1 Tax=Vitrella brassicaformis (strain CCMP3155) TaxID=1169540 RepID=A0A0G4FNW4_VITBC|nr:unnamed protein product [Vitrella brassicaformis CCMP3155]|mmetsp:Transcript_12669/g.30231  ORF Transcript_12669/g.30231 Transcript_12669/m.30231 type:complete len:160 (-) Transcript_12669:424-903(-)|eukprot:CEM15913.1 unnamed protein product [Vitrella brassicaformis CCMP3155]
MKAVFVGFFVLLVLAAAQDTSDLPTVFPVDEEVPFTPESVEPIHAGPLDRDPSHTGPLFVPSDSESDFMGLLAAQDWISRPLPAPAGAVSPQGRADDEGEQNVLPPPENTRPAYRPPRYSPPTPTYERPTYEQPSYEQPEPSRPWWWFGGYGGYGGYGR